MGGANYVLLGPIVAALVLGNIGPEAKDAVPVLERALKDQHAGVAGEAANALRRIDPETAAKAGVK